MAYSYSPALKTEYGHLWDGCKLNPGKIGQFKAAAKKIVDGKDKYQSLEEKTGVPWYFIGLVHLRESDCNFKTHLHNGDPLSRRTYHVPKGRPVSGSPPFTFEESAIDALKYEGYVGITDWGVERIAYSLEKYNGFGYRMHNVPSAYLWAGTNNYTRGKYIADNVWSATAVDTQLGAMGVLASLELVDSSIHVPYDNSAVGMTFKAQPAVPNPDMTQSRKWNLADARQKATVAVGVGAAGYKAVDSEQVSALHSTMDAISHFIHDYGIFMLLGGLAAGVIVDWYLKNYMKEDVQTGRTVMSGTLTNVDTGEST